MRRRRRTTAVRIFVLCVCVLLHRRVCGADTDGDHATSLDRTLPDPLRSLRQVHDGSTAAQQGAAEGVATEGGADGERPLRLRHKIRRHR